MIADDEMFNGVPNAAKYAVHVHTGAVQSIVESRVVCKLAYDPSLRLSAASRGQIPCEAVSWAVLSVCEPFALFHCGCIWVTPVLKESLNFYYPNQ